MKIDLDTLPSAELRGLFTALRLDESAEGASTLCMEFTAAPDWLAYMEPIVLMRGGKPLFCGRVTELSSANEAGALRFSAVATNYWYLFEHLPAAVQLSQLKEDAVVESKMLSRRLSNSLKSWQSVAQDIRISVADWTCTQDGETQGAGEVHLDVTSALYGMTPTVSSNRIFSTREIFTMMEEANPDAVFLAQPDGTLRVISIENCPTLDLPIDRLAACSDIAPMRDQDIDGVCVAVTYLGEGGKTYCALWPENVSMDSANIVFFTAEVTQNPSNQVNHMLEQAKGWYRAANTRQWSGSISAYPEDFEESPLGKRVNVTGYGVPEEWTFMQAIVTAVTWDFLAGRVELSLGKTMTPPTLHELEYETSSGSSGGGGGGGGGWGGGYATESETESESETQSVAPERFCGCAENWASLTEYLELVAKMFDYLDYTFPRWTPPNPETDMTEGNSGEYWN